MSEWTRAALVALTCLLLGVAATPEPGTVVTAVLGLTVAALVVVALAVATTEPAARAVPGISGRAAHERSRRGAFRRQTAPTTAGRPRPRAPGRA
jgi:hypothetical protein